MIVVTDTSVVLNLCCLHRENLLAEISLLFDQLESKAGFWIAPQLRKRVLDIVHE